MLDLFNRRWFRGTLLANVVVLPVLAYFFYPLGSDSYEIEFDRTVIDNKAAFLSEATNYDTLERPNIILILADDLGKTDISLYGSKLINTPNIDSIGHQGATFSEAYVTSSVCSPSRASLMTGRYQQRFGYEFQKHEVYMKYRLQYYGFKYLVKSYPWNPLKVESVPTKSAMAMQGLPPSEITLAELLRRQGYATSIIGKWHLGSADFALPYRRGFDRHYGFYNSHSLFAYESDNSVVHQHVEADWTDDYIWSGQRDGDCAIYDNEKVVIDSGYLTQRIAEESIDFIEAHQDEPFFLYIPFSAPHTPLQAPNEYVEQFRHIDDPVQRVYLAMIASLDDAVGSIMDRLAQLELDENTIVFFLSDNGGATYTTTTDNAPLKGGKITNFEGGMNVPFMVRWPGTIAAGTVVDRPISSTDIFATAANLARVDLPTDRTYDGVDLLREIELESEPSRRALFWRAGFNNSVLQDGWKLIRNEDSGQVNLYNLKSDKEEMYNVAKDNPAKVRELAMLFDEWSAELAEPLWPPVVTFRFDDGDETYYFNN